MYKLMGFIFGNLFEILFISFMFYKIKGLKNKKVLLFIGTFIIYFLSGFITSYSYNNQYLFYIIFNVVYFIMLKLMYKKNINIVDFFIIYYIEMILNFSSLICMKIVGYNYYLVIFNRLILILIYILSFKFNKVYKIIVKNWNRNDDTNKIKSVTLRNFFIIFVNFSLYTIYYFLINYLLVVIS